MKTDDTNDFSEIEQLIGKNLITFQSIELLLISIHSLRGGRCTESSLKKKKKKISKMSFGDLIDDKQIKKLDLSDDYEEIDEVIFNFDFLPDDQTLKELQSKLKKFSTSRNELVHKFQRKFNLMSAQGKLDAKSYLCEQLTYLTPLKEELRHIAQTLIIRRVDMQRTLESEEFMIELEKAITAEN